LRNGGIADGRIFNGEEAAANGLVDQVGYLEDAFARARELGGAEGAPVVRYQQQVTFADLLGITAEAAAERGGKLEIDLAGGLAGRLVPGQVYLLPPPFYAAFGGEAATAPAGVELP
jgi:protease-4